MKKVATVSKAGVSGTDREPADAVNESNREGCAIEHCILKNGFARLDQGIDEKTGRYVVYKIPVSNAMTKIYLFWYMDLMRVSIRLDNSSVSDRMDIYLLRNAHVSNINDIKDIMRIMRPAMSQVLSKGYF